MSMYLNLLFVIMTISSILQVDYLRFRICSTFAILTIAHDVISSYLPRDAYFISAAMIDLAIIIVLSLWAASSKLAFVLIGASVISIFANAIGFVLYKSDAFFMMYSIFYIVVYISVIIAMLADGRIFKHYIWFVKFRTGNVSSTKNIHKGIK